MRIVSLYSRHDGGYAIIQDGRLVEHTEFERYTRLKESGGNSIELFKKRCLEKNGLTWDDFDAIVAPMPTTSIAKQAKEAYDTQEVEGKVKYYAHHMCHAAHAYYCSPFNDSYTISIDNAGMEDDTNSISCGIYLCKGQYMRKVFDIPTHSLSLGDLWGRITRWVFKLSSGYPRGHQAGSIMAMAAMGDPEKYLEDFRDMMGPNHREAVTSPPGAIRGEYVPPEKEVRHPFLQKYREIAEVEQEKFNMAASLQQVTEEFLWSLVEKSVDLGKKNGFESKNICFSGGVALNSVSMGKIWKKLPEEWEMYLPPVPYDGGLNIGAAQYHYHNILGNPKVYSEPGEFASPYLGEMYSQQDIADTLKANKDKIECQKQLPSYVASLLTQGKIVSVFNGRSESGRRALGNRSILADPRNKDMKDMINEKVKHRQWYRPFAPSVLEEHGKEWFEKFRPSPYMGFVFQIREDMRGKAPAIEHFDGTARIQSVNREQNEWYYDLINAFYKLTGVPILLNTSFNDREPIVETPQDAINCFLGTDIDYLYFADTKDIVSKKDVAR